MHSNQNTGLEFVSVYIPLNEETRAERKAIAAEAEMQLRAYNRRIQDLKDELADAIKLQKKIKDKALVELEMGQFELTGDFISHINETLRTMEYYAPTGHNLAGTLIASRPLSAREIRQFKIDFKELIAQN